jgi:hypothetical protein
VAAIQFGHLLAFDQLEREGNTFRLGDYPAGTKRTLLMVGEVHYMYFAASLSAEG